MTLIDSAMTAAGWVFNVAVLSAMAAITVGSLLNNGTWTKQLITEYAGRLGPFMPGWSFFAPQPGMVDYHLFYRDRRVDGTKSAWRRVDDLHMERSWYNPVWNPGLYRSKGLFDIVEMFTLTAREELEQELSTDVEELESQEAMELGLEQVDIGEKQGSVMYMTLLNTVTQQDHSEMSEATQFALMSHSDELGEYKPEYISQFHKIEQ